MKANIKKIIAVLAAMTVLCTALAACGAKAELKVLDAEKVSAV